MFLSQGDLDGDQANNRIKIDSQYGAIMSIELLQTMEWSKLEWDQSFENVIDLNSLLPTIGKTYPVKFNRNEDFAKNGQAFLLWQPPHSELNGWDEKRPSEILRSYVLEGTLKHANSGGLTFEFEVLGSTRLVDFFSRANEEKRSPLSYIGQTDGSSVLQWQDARGVIKSKVEGYLYLSGSECKTSLDVILSIEDDNMCLHYSATLHNPAQYETVITKYYLSKDESTVFDQLLAQAEEIEDNSIESLEENQVYGAEYW